MFKFGKKKVEPKEPKEPKKKSAPADKTLKVEPIKIQFEEASPLAKAKAAADKKLCHVTERGLPSFEEFGARPSEMDGAEDGEPDTIKASSSVAPEDGLRASGSRPVSGGLPSRSPSPQPPANLKNATQRRPTVAPSDRGPQPPAQLYEREFSEHGPPSHPTSVYPRANLHGQAPDPRYVHAVERYVPPAVRPPNPPGDYHAQGRSLDNPYYPPHHGYTPDQYYEQPHSAPAPYYDQSRNPVYSQSRRHDAGPQYPSPGPDRYAPPVVDRFAGDYGEPRPYLWQYDDPDWRVEASRYHHTPSSRYPRQWEPAVEYPDHAHTTSPYDCRPAWPPHEPHRHPDPFDHRGYEQSGFYPHHQRARTMDSELPYRSDWPPVPPPHRPPPEPRGFPSHASQRELSSVPLPVEPLRRRSYSLQPHQQHAALPPPPPPSQANAMQEQLRRRRSQRYSDHTAQSNPYESPTLPDPRWPGPPSIQPHPPLPTPPQPPSQPNPAQERLHRRLSQRYSDHTGQPYQYESPAVPDPRRRGPPPVQPHSPLPTPPDRQRVASLTQQFIGMHIESPARPGTRPPSQAPLPAREQPSYTTSSCDPEHFGTNYNAPPASRSSSSFDFSSPSSSPSPASRTRSSSVEEQLFDLRHSSSRTSLHSVPEVDQEEDESAPLSSSSSPLQTRDELPTLEQFRRRRVAPPVWNETHQEDHSHVEQEEYGRQVTLERRAPSRKSETDLRRQRTQSRPQPPPPTASMPEKDVYDEATSPNDNQSESDYGYTNQEYYDSTAHNSPATNRTATTSPLKGEQVYSSSSSAPNTPSRQRTVVVKGPRGPRSPF